MSSSKTVELALRAQKYRKAVGVDRITNAETVEEVAHALKGKFMATYKGWTVTGENDVKGNCVKLTATKPGKKPIVVKGKNIKNNAELNALIDAQENQ